MSNPVLREKLNKYKYHPPDSGSLSLSEVLYRMRDFRLLYILSMPYWIICFSLFIADVSMIFGSYGFDWQLFTSLIVFLTSLGIGILMLIRSFARKKDDSQRILRNMQSYLPGITEHYIESVCRDLSRGMPFLKSHSIAVLESYILGSRTVWSLDPVVIPKEEIVEAIYEVWHQYKIGDIVMKIHFLLKNGASVPVAVNDKFGSWLQVEALEQAGIKTVRYGISTKSSPTRLPPRPAQTVPAPAPQPPRAEPAKPDPLLLDRKLRSIVSSLSEEDRERILSKIKKGDKLPAIKDLNDTAHCGLINARPIVENYEKYF